MIAELRNLGPRSAEMLADVGVVGRSDLESLGPVAVWLEVRRRTRVSLNLLYALHGALHDTPWDGLDRETRGR